MYPKEEDLAFRYEKLEDRTGIRVYKVKGVKIQVKENGEQAYKNNKALAIRNNEEDEEDEIIL